MKRQLFYVLMIASLLSLPACSGNTTSSDPESVESEITPLNSETESLSAENQLLSDTKSELSNDPADDSVPSDVSEKTSEAEPSNSESKSIEISPDEFVAKVSDIIDGSVGSDDSIDDVSLENGNLLVTVTLGDPAPFSYEDLMISRTSSITDEILCLEDCFDLWDTITIDFGEHGSIQNNHDNIQDDGYGSYFRSENFVITFNT